MTMDAPAPPTPPLPPTPPTPPLPPSEALPSNPAPLQVGTKSTALATLLAFIPFSLGHLYLGLYNRALVLFGAFWLAMFLEVPVVAAFFYFFIVIDAFRQAQLINAHGGESLAARPASGQGGLTLGIFLTVAGVVLLLRNWIDLSAIKFFLQDYSPALLVVVGIYLIFDSVRSAKKPAAEMEPGQEGY
jgi:hypothetical protein